MNLLAIDPGSTHSGWCVIDTVTCRPIEFDKSTNLELLFELQTGLAEAGIGHACIEMVASYGMPVGREVFETCVWIGRFLERTKPGPALVYRQNVKIHHCHSAKAKDSNIVQALVDRFAPGQPNHGKGTKAAPGWFYGFAKDVWQAYALAVYAADQIEGRAA